MRILILVAALGACASSPPGYRVPAAPGQFWIHPTRADAQAWRRDHPAVRLCILRVPDGFATRHCEGETK